MVRVAAALILVVSLRAQTAPPSFTLDHVLPSGSTRHAPLAPGMLISIYGSNLGPLQGCIGQVDTRRRQTPNPASPHQSFVETLIYPVELCDVQVFLGDLAAGLLYVQNEQINFQVPQNSPMDGMAELKVVYLGQSNSRILVRLGLDPVVLSVDGVARVGGPVWIKIALPFGFGEIHYPMGIAPSDFGCNQMEVRQNGVLLPRIPVRLGAVISRGNPCGNAGVGIPGPRQLTGRLPLHLQYRFEKPGFYEMRYTLTRAGFGPDRGGVLLQSAWTRMEVSPAQAPARQTPPTDPVEILSDYLPGLLGFPDPASLRIVLPYLYHSNGSVRQYTVSALEYWPQEEVDREAATLIRTRGPTDVIVNLIGARRPDLIEVYLPYLASDDPVLLSGAIVGVSRLISDPQQGLVANIRAQAEDRLIASAEHILRTGDQRTLMEFSVALGSVHDDRARDVLWDMVRRGLAAEQSLIAIAWHKDPRDLPRLGAMLTRPPEAVGQSRELTSIPYAIRNAYGDSAIPFLEAGLKGSPYGRVPANCARELIIAGRASGFAFVVDAIQGDRPYKPEMVQFVRDRFPELKAADEGSILAFIKLRAI